MYRIIIFVLLALSSPAVASPFQHGVASGDPTQDAVVIWTRVTPSEPGQVTVQWELSRNPSFHTLVSEGSVVTDASRDYTVKVDVRELDPGERYYYRFKALEAVSETGQTLTFSGDNTELVGLAVISCSHYETGYFNTYAAIAEDSRVDVVLHLGDYLYEYRAKQRYSPDWPRLHKPDNELLSLEDYRIRYAQYRADPDLQAVHRNHPFITVWDDHESANNSWPGGAENHEPSEGEWGERLQASRQAYFEWLPVREGERREIYRDFVVGDLLHLVMLDTRLAARDEQIYNMADPRVYAKDRAMLGAQQLDWLDGRLGQVHTTWTVFGNQVIFSPRIFGSDAIRGRNGDSWDGYPAERERVWELIRKHRLQNWIIATGDTHMTFVFDLVPPWGTEAYDPETGAGKGGMEFGVPSISAENLGDRLETGELAFRELSLRRSGHNPHLKFVDMKNHGYLRLEISHDRAEACYVYVKKLRERDSDSFEALRFTLPARADASHLYQAPE